MKEKILNTYCEYDQNISMRIDDKIIQESIKNESYQCKIQLECTMYNEETFCGETVDTVQLPFKFEKAMENGAMAIVSFQNDVSWKGIEKKQLKCRLGLINLPYRICTTNRYY